MILTTKRVHQFLGTHTHQVVTNIESLSGGEWSQAFGYKMNGQDFVVRFGQHHDDYIKDKVATQFSSVNLPIPKVLEIGKAYGGYFVISERAFGTMIDDLDKPAMRRVIPSVLATLDAIRNTDISQTSGYGSWNSNSKGHYASWKELLLDVVNDLPTTKIHGWKNGLKKSPIGDEPFNEAYAQLVKLAQGLPEVRSLVHNDLVHFNVMVNDDHITAVFDWANALYGDFLYDIAQFTFWSEIYPPIMGIDWEAEVLAHFQSIGLEVPMFKQRLQCCMINMGLGSQAYFGYKQDWKWLEPVAKRTLKVAKS